MSSRLSGIGMTSQRTRMRMIKRLREQGIVDEAVLKPDTESFATAPLFDGVGLTEGKSS